MKARTGELVGPLGLGAGAVEAALAGAGASLRTGAEETVERLYLDTFDGLLYGDGLTLRWEHGRLELLGKAAEGVRACVDCPEPAGALPAAGVPGGPLREVLVEVIEVRALLPLARVQILTRTLAVLDERDKTVARIVVEAPALLSPSGNRRPLRTRVLPVAVRGYDRELALARQGIARELDLADADCTLFEESVRAAGRRPEGVGSKIDVRLKPDERADAAVVAILTRLLEIMDATLPGTLQDIDSEFLHDYRVSVRRTRSVQRECKGVFGAGELALMRAEFKWLQQATGDSRDLDVYVLGFEAMRELLPLSMRGDLHPLLAVLRNRRRVAHRHMVQALQSERASVLRRDWAGLLAGLTATGLEDRPDAARPIGELSAERIRKVYRQMVRAGGAIRSDSPPEDYHELRKKGKELRYLLELFGQPLHDSAVVKPMIKVLKALQDVLGHHQDREVQMAMLQSLREEVSAKPGGAGALMAMGVLVDKLEADAHAARKEFAGVFAAFASKDQRGRMKATFTKP